MGDMGEVFKLQQEQNRERREARRVKNEAALRASRWSWRQTNNGASWLLRGRWRVAGHSRTFRGGASVMLNWLEVKDAAR